MQACSELERRKLYAEVVQPLVDKAAKREAALLATATEGFKALLRDSGISARSRWRDVKDKVGTATPSPSHIVCIFSVL
jgi:hypothetical protein